MQRKIRNKREEDNNGVDGWTSSRSGMKMIFSSKWEKKKKDDPL